uniref:Uncharacterized protein n=1 Tax=Nelumbo nucifera TaxID=4432 RepID=A0A822XFV6_NELNU|nr:TPA_asm: hypothetical protein HUJ06_020560 [Nelumbo nucifera]
MKIKSKIRIFIKDKCDEDLGYASVVLRSHTTLFASTFHALMPPSAVPMNSYHQEEQLKLECMILTSQLSKHNLRIIHISNILYLTYQAVRFALPVK